MGVRGWQKESEPTSDRTMRRKRKRQLMIHVLGVPPKHHVLFHLILTLVISFDAQCENINRLSKLLVSDVIYVQ